MTIHISDHPPLADQPSGDTPISIRALSPDNGAHIREVIDLFERRFGERYPVQSVYRGTFWKHHINIRFCSIGLFSNRQLIGHFSYCHDIRFPGIAFIQHAAFDERGSDFIRENPQRIRDMIERLALRHRCHSIACLVPEEISESSYFAEQTMGCALASIWPRFFPHGDVRQDGYLFLHSLFPLELPSSLPEHHRKCVDALNRRVKSHGSLQFDGPLEHVDSSKKKAFRVRSLPEVPANLIAVYPSLASQMESLADKARNRAENELTYLVLSSSDPRSADFVTLLEDRGFAFCGIVPMLESRNALLFSLEEPTRSLCVEKHVVSPKESSYLSELGSYERVLLTRTFPKDTPVVDFV
ncbi:MAG: hypothetical protein KDD64_11135 [Bdellovibrionales bacterium]|nr:hypothetical protein [Bdellovibrionales bacterium]